MIKRGFYFIVIAFLVAEFKTKDFDLCRLDDLWRHNVTKKWCKIRIYGISVQIQSLQGWNFAELMCCENYIYIVIVNLPS